MESFVPSSKSTTNRTNGTPQRVNQPTKTIVDNRPQTITQRSIQEGINSRKPIQSLIKKGEGWGVSFGIFKQSAWSIFKTKYDSFLNLYKEADTDYLRMNQDALVALMGGKEEKIKYLLRLDETEISYGEAKEVEPDIDFFIATLTDHIKERGKEKATDPNVGKLGVKTLAEVADFLHATEAHSIATGKGVHIVVIDSGFYNHAYFGKYPNIENQVSVEHISNNHFQYKEATEDEQKNMLAPSMPNNKKEDDFNGHGTAMVANILATAPDAQITMVTSKSFQEALAYAASLNPDIISTSKGVTIGKGNSALGTIDAIEKYHDEIRKALSRGVNKPILLDAVGNQGANSLLSPMEEFISIGGVFENDQREPIASGYSNQYETENLLNELKQRHGWSDSGTKDFYIRGKLKVRAPDISGFCGPSTDSKVISLPAQHNSALEDKVSTTGWGLASGSSCATPQVAGVCALIKQVFPSVTREQMLEILTSTATIVKKHESLSIEGFPVRLINADLAVKKALELAKNN